MTQYHVLCSHPGMRRGGRENPAFASYAAGDHTEKQLLALIEEPAITVVVGTVMTPDQTANMAASRLAFAVFDTYAVVPDAPADGASVCGANRSPDPGEMVITLENPSPLRVSGAVSGATQAARPARPAKPAQG